MCHAVFFSCDITPAGAMIILNSKWQQHKNIVNVIWMKYVG